MLLQLDTAFQLRVRRQGVKVRFLTFDSFKEAEQAGLRIGSDLSLSIVRDYAIASRTTLGGLMNLYRDEVCSKHKGTDVEISRH